MIDAEEPQRKRGVSDESLYGCTDPGQEGPHPFSKTEGQEERVGTNGKHVQVKKDRKLGEFMPDDLYYLPDTHSKIIYRAEEMWVWD